VLWPTPRSHTFPLSQQSYYLNDTTGSDVTARLETAREPSQSHIEPSQAIQRLVARNRSGTVQAIFQTPYMDMARFGSVRRGSAQRAMCELLEQRLAQLRQGHRKVSDMLREHDTHGG
jgi:hypothetical protein